MALVRVIPIVLYRGSQAVVTTKFANPRPVGSVINLARLYASRQVDELVFLDIGADSEPNFEVVKAFAKELNCPFAVGGGIRSIDDAGRLFELGADRVIIRTRLDVIEAVAGRYGSQAVVGSIMAYNWLSTYSIAKAAYARVQAGAGELLLQAGMYDGMQNGFDLELIAAVAGSGKVPVIAASGLGNVEHAVQAIQAGASAVAGAAIFQFTEKTPLDIARGLALQGIPTRT